MSAGKGSATQPLTKYPLAFRPNLGNTKSLYIQLELVMTLQHVHFSDPEAIANVQQLAIEIKAIEDPSSQCAAHPCSKLPSCLKIEIFEHTLATAAQAETFGITIKTVQHIYDGHCHAW